jgi:hypothetical protein
MDTSDKSRSDAPEPRERAPRERRKPYRKPEIHSSEVFERFTLQSCNQTPGECVGALE